MNISRKAGRIEILAITNIGWSGILIFPFLKVASRIFTDLRMERFHNQ